MTTIQPTTNTPFTSRELPLGESETLLRFRAERSRDAASLGGPAPESPAEWAAAARERTCDPARRARAVAALKPHWAGLDLPEAAQRSVELLENPETRIVIAGQQPALWGGPLMLAVKALAAVKTAELLTQAGVPAVPLFWIASEDHDVSELWGGEVVSASGASVPLIAPFPKGRRMIDRLTFEHTAETRFAAISPLLEGASPAVTALFRSSLAEAPADEFQRLFVTLFGSRGLLPVRPEWLRTLARPWIEAELSAPGEHAALVRQGIEQLATRGLPVPIPTPSELPFFWIDDDGARHRLTVTGDSVQIGGKNGPVRAVEDLKRELVTDPTRVSPDALLRPIIQDVLLEPACTILGPTELAYQWELGEVYRARGIQRPVLVPRPRVRVIAAEDAALLESHSIDLASLTPSATAVDLVASPEAEKRAKALAHASEPFVQLIEEWSKDDSLDAALRKRTDRLGRRLREDIEKLAAVLPRGAGSDVEAARREIEAVLTRIFPGGKEGERALALLGFLARHGLAGLDTLAEEITPGDGTMRVVLLDTPTGS